MDDFTRIKGIGRSTADKLFAAGIVDFAGLAGLAADHPAHQAVDIRDDWLAQARVLADDTPEIADGDLRVSVTAPAGRRRRAGLSFTSVPRILTEADFGADPDRTLQLLLADPALSVSPAGPEDG